MEIKNGIGPSRIGRMRRHEPYEDEIASNYLARDRNGNHGKSRDLNVNRQEYVPFRGARGGNGNFPFPYRDEGNSSYSYHHRDHGLEHDKVDILRKLDELKDRINRSCEITEKPSMGRRYYGRHHTDYIQESSHHTAYTDRRYMSRMRDPYSERNFTHEFREYVETYPEKNFRGPPPSQYLHHPYREDFVEGSNLHSNDPYYKNGDPHLKNGGPNYRHREKKAAPHRKNLVCRPISGGAPFITCCNCFELLKLPKKSSEKKMKMKCGVCFSLISFELGIKGYVVTVFDQVDTKIDDFSNEKEDEKEKGQHLSSIQHDSTSAELPIKEVEPSPHYEISCQESPDRCSDSQVVSEFDEGCKNKLLEEEMVSFDRAKPQDVAVETEIDVSLNEFSTSCVSQDSLELSKKEDHSSEEADGFHEGCKSKLSEEERVLLDREKSQDVAVETEFDMSLNEFSTSCVSQDSLKISKKEDHLSVEADGSQVYVNRHLIPDHEVEKAEELAGPIMPGEYWYDYKAGFWGVMGYPCLGIIMPNIEEFNYPLPVNCGAGNTRVFVNGRELHEKDLDLLASKGLPIYGSYIVDISGKVVDQKTGEELEGLGKLAPTVEREKCGFGMKVPTFIAELLS